MRAAAFTVALTLISSPVLANPAEWCFDAYNAGQPERAERHARNLLIGSFTPSEKDDVRKGVECLKRYSGKDYTYRTDLKRFLTDEEYGDALKQAEAERVLAAERRAAAEAAEKEAEAADKRRRDLRRSMEEERVRKESAAISRAFEACNRLYKRDPDNTILNPFCLEYFKVRGLPE